MDLNKHSCLIAYYLMTYTGGRNQLPDNERSTSSVCVCDSKQRYTLMWAGRFSTNDCPHCNTAATHHHSWLYSVSYRQCVRQNERLSNSPNVWAVSCVGLRPRYSTTKPAYNEITRDRSPNLYGNSASHRYLQSGFL